MSYYHSDSNSDSYTHSDNFLVVKKKKEEMLERIRKSQEQEMVDIVVSETGCTKTLARIILEENCMDLFETISKIRGTW